MNRNQNESFSEYFLIFIHTVEMPNYSTESSEEEEVSEADSQNYINDLSSPAVYDENYNNYNELGSSASTRNHIEKYSLVFGLILALSYYCRQLH